MAAQLDPYATLGVSPGVSDAEIRKAYRRLVQKYHPDHNGGSEESERRFEEVQEAYAQVRELRARGGPGRAGGSRGAAPPPPRSGPRTSGPAPPRPSFDPDVEARAAALERELKQAQAARERAREAARQAAAEAAGRAAADAAAQSRSESEPGHDAHRAGRPSDEELGYIKTEDSFTKILADAREELSGRLSDAHDHPVVRRVSDLIDELDELASKLTGERRSRDRSG
jgi:curved DNA-binding protein CbpA